MGEVVLFGHVAAVRLCGVRELRVGHERALAVVFAFLVDQAQHRGAHLFDVALVGRQVGVGTGGGRGGRGDRAAEQGCQGRRERAQVGSAGMQRRDGQACHVRGIG